MNYKNKSRTFRTLAFSALFSAVAHVPAYALTMPVIDFSVLGQTKTQVTQMASQLQELTQMKDALTSQVEALGGAGVLDDLMSSPSFAASGSSSDFYSNAAALGYDPCAVTLCLIEGNDKVGYTDIKEAGDWVERSLFSSGIMNGEQLRDLKEVRRRAVRYSATNGLAMANVLHTDLVRSGQSSEGLEEIVSASTTVRGDIRANSAIALASYKNEVQQLAALTSILGVVSAQAIETLPMQMNEATIDGGNAVGQVPSQIPDVYKETDFDRNNPSIRTRVTPLVPKHTPGQALSSPSKSGGGVFARVAGGLGTSQAGAIINVLGGGSGGSSNGFDVLQRMNGGSGAGLSQDNLISGMIGAINENTNSSVLPGLDIFAGQINSTSSDGLTGALYGAGGILASVNGKGDLGQFLEDAGRALSTGSNAAILDFATGQIGTFAANGNSQHASLLSQLVEQASHGAITPEDVLRLASQELVTASGLSGTGIEAILSADPAALTKGDLQNLTATLAESIGRRTSDQSLVQAGQLVRSYSPAKISEFNSSGTRSTPRMVPSVQRLPSHSAPEASSGFDILSGIGN